MLKKISRLFIKGILTILPIFVTAALLFWFINIFEAIFGGFLRLIFPHDWYRFGMGVGLGVLAIFLIGLLVQVWLGQKIFEWFEGLLMKIPFFKEIYRPIKQLQNMLITSDKPKAGYPVMVKLANDVEMLGIVTNKNPGADFKCAPGKIAVLLIWSYQMGGFTIFVKEENVTPLDMSVEEAFKFSITAGISTSE